MTAPVPAATAAVDLEAITRIELIVTRRLQERTAGEHRSRAEGAGFEFVGLRDWQAGDRVSAIDWPQSSLTNFAPLIVREFEQPSTATVVAIADHSLSTRCGLDGVPIAAAVARAVATVGMSATFFQDPFGLVTFDTGFEHLAAIRPRTGKGHVVHCVDAYQHQQNLLAVKRIGGVGTTLAGYLRSKSMLPVISDFLFDDPGTVLKELAFLNATHDVFIVLIDGAFAFELPKVSAGWVETVDVETGRARMMSARAVRRLAERIRDWQKEVRRLAKDLDLDVVQVGLDQTKADIALSEFVAERRLRKMYN